MKKFFTYSIIFILLIGIFVPNVYAQTVSGALTGGITDAVKASSSPGDSIMKVISTVSLSILWLMSWLLWAAGSLLNLVLEQTIIKMAANIDSMTGINVAWKTIRDVMNMFFIFILIYNAILIIISQSTVEKIKGIITGIVITALLINFSMFFTKIIIDASNVVTIGFYNSILKANGDNVSISTYESGSVTAIMNSGISGSFVKSLQVTSFFNPKNLENLNKNSSNTSLLIIGLGGSILFLILAFVFFAVSIMFIIRYLVLIFLLMFSPLGFIGFGLPQLKGQQSKWWETLIGQSLFGPIYMFLTWAILVLINSPGFIKLANNPLTSDPNSGWGTLLLGNAGKPDPGSLGLLINFVVIVGLVILSLTQAKKQASSGYGFVADYTGKLTSFAGGAILGGSAAALRNTAGRLANKASESEWLKEKAKDSYIGKLALKASDKAASGSFDLRAASLGGKTTLGSQLKDTLKTDFGSVDSKKQNFRAILDSKAEKEVEFAKKLKVSDSKKDEARRNVEDAERILNEETEKKKIEVKNDPAYLELEKREEQEKKDNEKTAKEIELKNEKTKEKQRNISDKRKEIETLQKQKNESSSEAEKFQIEKDIKAKNDEVELLRKEITADKADTEAMATAMKANTKNATAKNQFVDKWMDEKLKNVKDEVRKAKNEQDQLKKIEEERIEAFATNIENPSIFSQNKISLAKGGLASIAALVAGGPISLIAGAGVAASEGIMSKADKKVVGSKIRKGLKVKSYAEQIAELTKKAAKEEEDKKKSDDKSKDEKPKEEPKKEAGDSGEKPKT